MLRLDIKITASKEDDMKAIAASVNILIEQLYENIPHMKIGVESPFVSRDNLISQSISLEIADEEKPPEPTK